MILEFDVMSHQIAIDPMSSFGLNFDSRDLVANQQGRITSRTLNMPYQQKLIDPS